MTEQELKDLESKIYGIFNFTKYNDGRVEAQEYDGRVYIKVFRMYEYVPLSLKELLSVAKVIGTDRFEVDSWSSSGCETCDYGSRYEKEFIFKLSDVGQWDVKLQEK